MTEIHREGHVSLHVHEGAVELRDSTASGGVLRHTTGDDPILAPTHPLSENGLSINEVCRRYAELAGVDFETAAAAVLDALEEHGGPGAVPDADGGGGS